MERYSVIETKQKREIVLLRGSGCRYARCAFCDYYEDKCANEDENFALNSSVLDRVTGAHGELEVINSGSVFELDARTLEKIRTVCSQKGISVLHLESHHLYREQIPVLRKAFAGVVLKMKLGLETFDFDLRENILKKGIPVRDPAQISQGFDEANFLFGIAGQTRSSMERDIELGLRFFERICLNVMCKNSTNVLPDRGVIETFVQEIYPRIEKEPRIDILLNNTDFGVGD